ncbi:hypothetical protein OIU79_005769 [Salix purpurea]|uniref:Uncharacterized protein n=1 Tax=Salix purpurea TaxID=77065 RepID=A0A9Q0Z1H2_SALPP|nr:hypothetical protein OIU79_005769 [Salix purpurea]
MHLWPTMRIRDSFKSAYLKKLEWNLHRMNNEKKQRSQETSDSNQQRLLDDEIFSCSSLVAIVVSVVELAPSNRFLPHLFQFDNPQYLTDSIHFDSLKVASTRTRNDAVSEGIKGSLEIIFQKVEQGLCSFLTSVLMTSQIARVLLSSILNRKMM